MSSTLRYISADSKSCSMVAFQLSVALVFWSGVIFNTFCGGALVDWILPSKFAVNDSLLPKRVIIIRWGFSGEVDAMIGMDVSQLLLTADTMPTASLRSLNFNHASPSSS